MSRRPRAFAFDLGGVIVDVDKRGLYRLHPDPLVVAAAFFGPEHDAMSVGARSCTAFLDHARAVLGAAPVARVDAGAANIDAVDAANDAIDDAVDDPIATAWCQLVRFSAGGLALVAEAAARTRVLVWSNTDPLHAGVLAPALLAHVAARDLITSFGVGAMKPERAFFTRALAASGLDADDVLFVDDRADNVAAARAAGVDAHVVDGVDGARAMLARL